MKRVRKAIIPAAGMGTRFLPATKSMPKEMLPIIDKPVLQYVIEEAVASGIEDILIVTGRGKRAIENHLDYNPELEVFLRENGKDELIDQVRDIGDQCRVFYIRQKVQRGLGDAINLGRAHIGDEPFAVLLGDTIIDVPEGEAPGLKQCCDVFEEKQASVVAVRHVPREWTSRYGIVDGAPEPGHDNLVRLKQLVEKPRPENAPSDLAIAGRYIFTPDIFDCIDRTTAGVGGEIQLTDAMNLLAREEASGGSGASGGAGGSGGGGMYALAWNAKRYDIGNRVDYAKCFIDYALRRDDTRDAIVAHLKKRLEQMENGVSAIGVEQA